tara:strand:+ start:576 stop:1400 length:825 start_codon:yes stop_codon:yes gene_type:complete
MLNNNYFKEDFINIVNNYLTKLKEERDSKTFYLVSKSLLKGGKHIRPLIFLNLIETRSFKFSEDISKLAISIEMLHCASLIIDDLPSMDNDNERRGEPTVHKQYGVKKAHLIANKYILYALCNILKICDKESKILIFEQLKNASVGQYFDLTGVTNSDNHEMSDIINLKTAPFFNIAFILAGFYIKEVEYNVYIKLGNLFSGMFQICDDIEDLVKDLKKKHTMNHCILMGKEKCISLYLEKKKEFVALLQESKMYIPYFIYLIEKLDKKIGIDL